MKLNFYGFKKQNKKKNLMKSSLSLLVIQTAALQEKNKFSPPENEVP